jgi:hypothetical protein
MNACMNESKAGEGERATRKTKTRNEKPRIEIH